MDLDKLLVVCTNSAGDRKLYAILRHQPSGMVWRRKHGRFEDFVNDKYLDYAIPLTYEGGDIYSLYKPKDILVIVYIQSGKEPDIYDQIYHVFGVEMPKEIPEKIRPMAPMVIDPVSSPRSKVKQDAYSE